MGPSHCLMYWQADSGNLILSELDRRVKTTTEEHWCEGDVQAGMH